MKLIMIVFVLILSLFRVKEYTSLALFLLPFDRRSSIEIKLYLK